MMAIRNKNGFIDESLRHFSKNGSIMYDPHLVFGSILKVKGDLR